MADIEQIIGDGSEEVGEVTEKINQTIDRVNNIGGLFPVPVFIIEFLVNVSYIEFVYDAYVEEFNNFLVRDVQNDVLLENVAALDYDRVEGPLTVEIYMYQNKRLHDDLLSRIRQYLNAGDIAITQANIPKNYVSSSDAFVSIEELFFVAENVTGLENIKILYPYFNLKSDLLPVKINAPNALFMPYFEISGNALEVIFENFTTSYLRIRNFSGNSLIGTVNLIPEDGTINVYSQESEPAITLTANVVEHTEYFQFAVTYNSKPSIDLTITGATVDGLVLEFSNCQTSAINVDAQNASTLGIHYNSDTLIYPSINLSGFNKDMVFVDSYNNGHPNLASMQTVGNAAQPGVTTINCLNWNDEDDADIIALLEGKGYVVIIE